MNINKSLIIFYLLLPFSFNVLCNKIIKVSAKETFKEETAKKVILIDPGHGGFDGGAVSKSGTLEKDINLSIALKLRDELKNKGYIVLMTREDDKSLNTRKDTAENMKYEDLANRCILKRDSKCDIFISIHQNDFSVSKYSGAQVWYSKCEKSKKLAEIIQSNLRKDLNRNNKRRETCAGNDYKILRCHLNIPSVIVECGFLSNSAEEMKLKDETYQQKIAQSISKSVEEFCNTIQF